MTTQYISIDEQKKLLQGYSPNRAEAFHKKSARSADRIFAQSLKENSTKKVILLNGGSASGKTEFYYEHLCNEDAIIYDGTLSTVKGVSIKLQKIKKSKKRPFVYAIIPDDLQRAFIAFLNRDRKFSDEHFYRTHCGSRKTILWLATTKPEVNVHLFESSYDNRNKLRYRPFEFDSPQEMVEFLWSIQYTEDELVALLASTLSSHHAQR